jgi:hypothetical protein
MGEEDEDISISRSVVIVDSKEIHDLEKRE